MFTPEVYELLKSGVVNNIEEVKREMQVFCDTAGAYSKLASLPTPAITEETHDFKLFYDAKAQIIGKIYSSKASELMQGFISEANNRHFLNCALIARSLVETYATFIYHADNIMEQAGKVPFTISEEDQILKHIAKVLKGSKFDWGALLKHAVNSAELEEVRSEEAVHINDCLRWVKKKHRNGFMDFYSLLCDMVHPNMGSNFLIMKSENGSPVFGGTKGDSCGVALFAGIVCVLATIMSEMFIKVELFPRIKAKTFGRPQ